jgi:hypothetical protein
MRKIKEVLRLKFEVGLGLRAIARSCSIGLGTAHEYLQRAEAAKITWPLGPEWADDRLEAALFGGPPRRSPTVLSFGKKCRFHRLSLVIGVVNLSLGKTQASGVVLMEVARLRRPSSSAAATCALDATVAVGGVPAGKPGWLPVQPLLRAVPAVATETGCRLAAGAQGRREAIRRLGRNNDTDS